ncbi:MAG: enoyl-CoA hydratase/isomerase family protein, partial [Sphingopyxis sp.]
MTAAHPHVLTISKNGHVAELLFASPPHNHATVGLLRDLGDALAEMDGDGDVRAIVLASDGRPFCGGADLASADGFGAVGDDPIAEFYEQALRLFASRKPIIAAVQGAAVGAGLGLAVAADFRVAGPDARFAGNFTRLGFHPGFGLTHTLPRLIGQQRALEMMMTSARYKAQDVAHWGLVDRLVPSTADVRCAAHAMAAEIAQNAP